MSAWVLIIFLKWNAGGVVAVDMPSETACVAAIAVTKKAATYQDAFCLERK